MLKYPINSIFGIFISEKFYWQEINFPIIQKKKKIFRFDIIENIQGLHFPCLILDSWEFTILIRLFFSLNVLSEKNKRDERSNKKMELFWALWYAVYNCSGTLLKNELAVFRMKNFIRNSSSLIISLRRILLSYLMFVINIAIFWKPYLISLLSKACNSCIQLISCNLMIFIFVYYWISVLKAFVIWILIFTLNRTLL